MIHARLIVGGTAIKRSFLTKQIVSETLSFPYLKPHPDIFVIEGLNSISINQIRELKEFLSFKPYLAPLKIALIPQAEKMTIPAQNALLKTLEEPSANSLIILNCPKTNLLLPTIISRCQVISLPFESEFSADEEKIVEYKKVRNLILKSGVGQRLKIAADYTKNKNQAVEFVQALLFIWREMMLQNPSLNLINSIRNIQDTLEILKANVNPNLAISNLLLSLP